MRWKSHGRFLEGESSWGPTYLPYNLAGMVALNIDKLIKRYQETRPFKLFAKWSEWLDEVSYVRINKEFSKEERDQLLVKALIDSKKEHGQYDTKTKNIIKGVKKKHYFKDIFPLFDSLENTVKEFEILKITEFNDLYTELKKYKETRNIQIKLQFRNFYWSFRRKINVFCTLF